MSTNQSQVYFGKAFESIKVGSRVGVLVDLSNNLRLYVDGSYQGIAARDVRQPCFAVFDICNKVIQVTALPTSKRLSEPLMSQLFKYFQHKVSFLDAAEDEFHMDILQTEEAE